MIKRCWVVLCLVVTLSSLAYGSAQAPDVIIYNGAHCKLLSTPLESYWNDSHPKPEFGIYRREGITLGPSTGNWRGYQATWEILGDVLYLIGIDSISEIGLNEVFPQNDGRVRATWYNGTLRIPKGEMLVYVHFGYAQIYSEEIFLTAEEGKIVGSEIINHRRGADSKTENLLPLILDEAKKGSPEAEWWIGRSYYYGRVLPKNDSEATNWYAKAAGRDHVRAQIDLADMYASGLVVKQDYETAAQWYRRAADRGDSWAQFELGRCYDYGRGLEQNYAEAAKWYRAAAMQGLDWAQVNLGLLYNTGKGVAKDRKEAAKWFLMAAERGNAIGQATIGFYTILGWGVERDYDLGEKWIKMAVDQGNSRAKELSEEICHDILFLNRDKEKGLQWCIQKANSGDRAAQYHVGVFCYGNGDHVQGKRWLNESAKNGYEPASAKLEEWKHREREKLKATIIDIASVIGLLVVLAIPPLGIWWLLLQRRRRKRAAACTNVPAGDHVVENRE
jgi:TPR repeat protein